MAEKKAKTSGRHARVKPSKIVGSSYTWRTHELQEYKVSWDQTGVDAKSLVYEKWWNFDRPKHYAKGRRSVTVLSV